MRWKSVCIVLAALALAAWAAYAWMSLGAQLRYAEAYVADPRHVALFTEPGGAPVSSARVVSAKARPVGIVQAFPPGFDVDVSVVAVVEGAERRGTVGFWFGPVLMTSSTVLH